ncbi:MAG: ComEA family DNA-binding protein [Candidatus Methylomirabilales bacterium]
MFRKVVGIFVVAGLLLLVSGIGLRARAYHHRGGGKGQAAVETININTASREELTRLNGVGPAYADRIIEYREQHGRFQRPEEIMRVKGIGRKIWETNRDIITVE